MKLIAKILGKEHVLQINSADGQKNIFDVQIDEEIHRIDVENLASGSFSILCEGKSYDVVLERLNPSELLDYRLRVGIDGESIELEMLTEQQSRLKQTSTLAHSDSGVIRIVSPMPGKILRVLVLPGDSVIEGQGLVVVEAMKMENELKTPKNAVVKEILVNSGDSVESGAQLLSIEIV